MSEPDKLSTINDTPTTADGIPFTPGMTLYMLDGEMIATDPGAMPPEHGGSLWIEWGDRDGAVLSILYASADAAKSARESPRNQCFACGKHLRLFHAAPAGKPIGMIDDGLYFRATGNFGSTVMDGPDDEFIEVVICDDCVAGRRERTRYWKAKERRTVGRPRPRC